MLPDYFHIQTPVKKWGKETYVNWSKCPTGKAIVFIHGFNGSSMSTFGDFNLEFRYREEFKGYDVYFYGYDSLFKQIPNSALNFLNFLRAIHNNIATVIKNSGASIVRDEYSKIVIIAHSLGAVVSRLALTMGFKTESAWLGKCELILFAPAHKGARDEILAFMDIPGLPKLLGPVSKYFIVTLRQLMDTSKIIGPMENKIADLIYNKKITTFTQAKQVIWAGIERVVINDVFLEDEEAIEVGGKRHEEVCKPEIVKDAYGYVSKFL